MTIQLNEKEQKARKMVCLPLDGMDSLSALEERVYVLSPYVGLFKIGKESFTRFGVDAVKVVQGQGGDVFLDLKYHDIPETAKGASKAALTHAVWMFNVHASGGREMMRAAIDEAKKYEGEGVRPNVIGVTVLTSIGAAEYLDVNRPLVPNLKAEEIKPYLGMKSTDTERQDSFARTLQSRGYAHLTVEDARGLRCNAVEQEVLNLAQMANESGLDGIVCSAADLYAVQPQLPPSFMYVTPGIQGTRTPAGEDQKRVFSPGHAVRDGSKILVVGRAITGDKKNPLTPEQQQQAAYEILQDMAVYL